MCLQHPRAHTICGTFISVTVLTPQLHLSVTGSRSTERQSEQQANGDLLGILLTKKISYQIPVVQVPFQIRDRNERNFIRRISWILCGLNDVGWEARQESRITPEGFSPITASE